MKKFILTVLFAFVFLAAGVYLALGAGQVGVGGTPLRVHNHSGSSQGGSFTALQINGNFLDYGNNNGNINIDPLLSGGAFFWRPKRQAFRAGLSNGTDLYDINVGSYSWAGGYNTSAGHYSLGFGTDVHADRPANIALGYYLKSTAGNTVTIGSGPGYGGNTYAVNNATGSIQFFPLTTTSETRPALALYRDGTAQAVGAWNFISSPTINGVAMSTSMAVDNTKVLKTGDVMSGPLTAPSMTVTGNISQTGVIISSGTGNNYFAGAVGIGQMATATGALTANGGANKYSGFFRNNAPAGTSLGVLVDAGATAADSVMRLRDRTGSTSFMSVLGNGVAAFVSTASIPAITSVFSVSSATATMLTIRADGNVGIGTTSPSAKLHVKDGSVYNDGTGAGIYTTGTSTAAAVAVTGATSGYALCFTASGVIGHCTAGTYPACATCIPN